MDQYYQRKFTTENPTDAKLLAEYERYKVIGICFQQFIETILFPDTQSAQAIRNEVAATTPASDLPVEAHARGEHG